MAQQPRQQRIGFYGKFTPTALDTSESDKMRALAGLGQSMGNAALAIGKPIIEAKRAEEGAQAAEDAAKDPVTGEVLEVPTMNAAKFGSSQFGAAAQQRANQINAAAISTYKTNLLLDIEKNMSNLSSANSSNTSRFDFVAANYKKGLMKDIPADLKPAIERFYFSEYEKNRNAVYKQETTNIKESAKASYTLARDSFKKDYIDLMFEGKTTEAAKLKAEFDANMMPGFLTAGAISQENFMKDEVALADTARLEQEYGRINKEIISNDEFNMDEKLAASKQYLTDFDKTELGLDRKEKRELRASIVAQFDAMEKDEIAKIQAQEEASFLQQTENANAFDDLYLDADISNKEKIKELERLNMENMLSEKSYTSRKRFITARKEYNSENSSASKEKIYNQIYNTNLLRTPADVIKALDNIRNNIIEEEAAGNLQREDRNSLEAVLRQVGSASGAKARSRIAFNFMEIKTQVNASLPSEDWGTAYGDIYLEAAPELKAATDLLVQEAMAKAEADGDTLSDRQISRIKPSKELTAQIYKKAGDSVIRRIQVYNADRSNEAYNTAVQQNQPPVIKKWSQTRILSSGTLFQWKGQTYKKD